MAAKGKLSYLRALIRLDNLRTVPFRHLWLQLAAVFFLFSSIGFLVDLIEAKGQMPYAVVLVIAATCGLDTALWVLVLARLSKVVLLALIVLQFFISPIDTGIANWMIGAFNLPAVHLDTGINFAAIGILSVLVLSYVFFIAYIRTYGLESFRMRNELAQAQEVQQVILPEPRLTPPTLVVESEYRPAREVGGDFFQIIPDQTGGGLLIVAGDVAGKGLKAGMLVALLVGAIRTAAQYNPDPTAVLSTLNHLLMGRGDAQATCLAIHISRDGAAKLANSGHIAPYLNGEPLPMDGALPLGMIESPESSSMQFELKDGDRLMLMSDGVAEATDDDGHLFGFERVHQLLQTPRSVTEVANAAQTFGQEDDISVISITRTDALNPATA